METDMSNNEEIIRQEAINRRVAVQMDRRVSLIMYDFKKHVWHVVVSLNIESFSTWG